MSNLSAKERNLLQRVDANKDLQPLFLKKVRGLKWFDELASRGYFDANKIPAPTPANDQGYVIVPTWQVTSYLVKTAPELESEHGKAFANQFLDILVSATKYAQDHEFGNYRAWADFAEIISYIPTELISTKHIDVLEYWLDDPFERGYVARHLGEKWLPTLLDRNDHQKQALAVQVLRLIFKVDFRDDVVADRSRRVVRLRVDPLYAISISRKIAEVAAETVGIEIVLLFDDGLRTVLNQLNNDSWSCIWQPAIEDHEQNKHRDDPENVLLQAYRDALLGYIRSNHDGGLKYIRQMLRDKHETIRRLAIHSIDENCRLCYELFDVLVDSRYLADNYRHEMWRFLSRSYGRFTKQQKKQLLRLISELSKTDAQGNEHPSATAYHQAIWLAAIKEFGKKEKDLYLARVKTAGAEPDHPSFSNFMSVVRVRNESPISPDLLQSMTVAELVSTFSTYNDNNRRIFEPGIEGLASAFRDAIKASPLKFYSQLIRFLDVDLAYVYQITEGYRELWTEKKELPWDDIWGPLLEFCYLVVRNKEFWSEEATKDRAAFVANRHWIVTSIGRLIESGVKSDSHAFDQSHLPMAEQIVLILLDREFGTPFDDITDAVSVSINSPRGQALEALINISLRLCRISDRENNGDHATVWNRFEPMYEEELNRKEKRECEFVTLVAMCLPNFLYLSTDWTLKRLDRIFDKSNNLWWNCALQGYAYVGKVYDKIFYHLKENGDYLLALDDSHIDDRTKNRLVQQIGIAYLSDFENLTDHKSLIWQLLLRSQFEELTELIFLVWGMREAPDRYREKIYQLWPRLVELADTSVSEGKRLASQLCLWIVFVDNVDKERRDLLLDIAQYAHVEYHSFQMLEELAHISNNQPFEAHRIWMKMIEGSATDYPEESIKEILANLAAHGPTGVLKAREATSAYIRVGIEGPESWLRELIAETDVKAN